MKIRITDNTLRIRLSQSDLTDLSTLKPVTVSLPMGALEFTIQLQVQQSYIHGAANTAETPFDNDSEIHFDHHSINISTHSYSCQKKPEKFNSRAFAFSLQLHLFNIAQALFSC